MIMFSCMMTFSQISGTFTIPGPEYPTIESAIVALNSVGVTAPGVTFNITPGYTETFTNSLAGVITTTTSDAGKPIIFQKAETEPGKASIGPNPVVTAATGVSASYDAIFALAGTDYVTFDGINIRDNPLNTTSSARMEYGFWLARASATDGTQHVTIKNCKIYGLEKNYAIASTERNLTNVAITPTAPSGSNSYNKIYNDSIVNTTIPAVGNKLSQQVYFNAHSSVQTSGFYDEGNEIGVEGGNVFLNSMYLSCSYQRGLKIFNNQFTSVDIYPVTASYHIYTSACRNTKTHNNTIGNFTLGVNMTYRAISEGSGSSDTVEITNNVIQNINYSSVTTGSFTGIDYNTNGAYIKISGNTVRNNILGGAATTTGFFMGISVQNGNMLAGSYCNVYGNTISGNTITSSSASAVNSYIRQTFYCWSSSIYNNTITNNVASCTGTTHGIDAQCITANLIEKRIYGNTISNLSNTNGTFHGIRHVNGLRSYIYQNKINNVSATGASNPVINAITVENTTTAIVAIYNNYIYELKTPASSGARQITGLNIVAGQVVDAHFNTIYLDASSTGANFGTAGIYANTATILKLRSNIVENVSVPTGTGLTVALQFSSTSISNFDPASNNNNYYAGRPGPSNLIFYDGTNSFQSLLEFQTRVIPAENASITEITPFTNVTTSPYNLRIFGFAGSECESGGVVVQDPEPVNVDFYGTPRYPNPGYPIFPSYPPARPDIGAEEFGGIWKDRSAPNVAITPLPNTPLTTSRSLTATITDLTGVPVSGIALPVLYWNVNNGAWNAATAVHLTGNQYSFSFGGGVALNDSIRYFFVAQDVIATPGPNVGSTPLGADGCTINPPSFTTPPANLFAYKIVTGLCGTFNVGTGGDYTTLTDAINDLNAKAVTCPVTLLLTDPLYVNETFPILVNRIPGLSAVNTLTIKPAPGVTPAINGSNAVSLVTLNGANYVTIDGSNSGGTDRSLTFYNSNANNPATVVYFSNAGGFNTSSNYCVLKNCKIKGSPQVTNTTYGVRTNSTSGGGNDNITIENNEIYSARIGVRIQGTLAYPATNCKVLNNMVGSPVDSVSIQLYGIYNLYADNTLIQGNDVMGPSVSGNANLTQMGISVYTLATNTKIKDNKVHGFYNNTPNYGAQGIQYRAEGYTVTEISNNVIYDIKGAGSAALYQDIAGISVLNGGNVKIWNNSVNLTGEVLGSASVTKSGCIVLSNAATNIDIRNNILKNSLKQASGTPIAKTYGIYIQGAASSFSNLDNNDYYIDGTGANIGELNYTTDYATLSAWQSATGMDQHSFDADPVYTSATDLKPNNYALSKKGVRLPEVTTDITQLGRSDPPDMGAYEFGFMVRTVAATGITWEHATLNGVVLSNTGIVETYFDYGETTGYGQWVGGTPGTVFGTSQQNITAVITDLLPSTTYHFRARILTSGDLQLTGDDFVFTTPAVVPAITTVQNIIVAGGQDTCFNAQQTITIAGSGTTFIVQDHGRATMIAGHSVHYLEGTKVEPGGYMLGRITTDDQYCGYAKASMMTAMAGQEENPMSSGNHKFRIYPNPTAGAFTLEVTDAKVSKELEVEIYGINGDKVLKTSLEGQNSYQLSLAGKPAGIYFVRMTSGGTTEAMKIIKQ